MSINLAQPIGSLAVVDAPPAQSWKRRFGGRWTRLLLIAVLVTGGAVVYKRSTGRAVHDADHGPVRTGSDTTTSIHADIGQVVTFGGIIVENYSKRPAILESIRIEPPLEPAVSLVDVKVAGINRGIGQVGADVGFPPSVIRPETLQPLAGAIVPPGEHDWGVEVLMGFRLNQPGQFGFHHALIDYRIGGKRHRVRVSDGFFICGGPDYPANCNLAAVPAPED